MKIVFTTSILLFGLLSTAQDFSVSFIAQGDASTIDEVIATNLATNEYITMPGDVTLVLHSISTVVNVSQMDNLMRVAPNPYKSYTNLQLKNEKQQKVKISLTNLAGNALALYDKELTIGDHALQVSANSSGIYLLSIETEAGVKCLKIFQSQSGNNSIEYMGVPDNNSGSTLKSLSADYILNFTPDDIISYSISSGDLTTIVNEKTTETKTITAELYACKDGDANNYSIVKIGEQVWMAENLKSTKYADGTAIPLVTDNTAWANLGDNNTDKAYCFCNNDASLGGGALYTYAASVNGTPYDGSNPVQGICPTGWHMPSDAEWTELENYLIANGYNYDGTTSGDKMGKSLASTIGWSLASTIGWRNSSTIGDVGNSKSTNNSTGFSALSGGLRLGYNDTYSFTYASYRCYWWSSTEYSSSWAYGRVLNYDYPDLRRHSSGKSVGFSVRCVRD